MKFCATKQKKIVYCIIDNTELCQSGWAKEVCKNISDNLIHKTLSYNYDVYISNSEDAVLREVANENYYSHAVIVASGTSLKLSEKLYRYVEEKCAEDITIAGHILDRGESYYELHHQFYILRLSDYIELNFPLVGVQADIIHTQVEPLRSEGNVHDEYVPLWIKNGTTYKQYSAQLHGWHILSNMLSASKTIVDIGPDIRNSKQYLYYEYDHVFIKHLPDIYYYDFFCANFPHHSNTDSIDTVQFAGPVDQYVTIGTGFNWIQLLTKFGYNNDTEVIFTDVNPNCLRLMEAMVTEWDGTDYRALYEKIVRPLIPVGPISITEDYYQQAHDNWVAVKDSVDDWDTVWQNVKKLTFKFILIDYTATYNLDWLQAGKNTFMNVSDLFTYASSVNLHPLKYRIACENKLIASLQDKDPTIMLHFSSRACSGFINEQLPMYCSVSEFNLIDINVLNTPPWHAGEWNSLRMLG